MQSSQERAVELLPGLGGGLDVPPILFFREEDVAELPCVVAACPVEQSWRDSLFGSK